MIGLVFAANAAGALAQADYPAKPVRFIVPAAPGPFDNIARVLGDRLHKRLGQPFIVENIPGGSMAVGASALARAAPDGYAIALVTLPASMAEYFFPDLGLRLTRDVAPIVQISWNFFMLALHPSVPARTVPELVAHLKAHPGKLNYGSGGIGSPAHVAGALFARDAGVDILHVPYKSMVPGIQDLLAGRVQMMFALTAGLLPHVRAGKLNAIAVVGRERLASLPDLPSMAEAGYPSIEVRDWLGLIAPARTPSPIIERLNRELNAILQEGEVRERLSIGNTQLVGGTPEAFGQLIAKDSERWGRFIRESGIKPE